MFINVAKYNHNNLIKAQYASYNLAKLKSKLKKIE